MDSASILSMGLDFLACFDREVGPDDRISSKGLFGFLEALVHRLRPLAIKAFGNAQS